jgi:hypothetical protein
MYYQQEAAQVSATLVQMLGAGAFGIIIGWYVYFINRYRKGDVQFSDLATVIGIIGGGAVLSLFPAQTDLFGAYGIGLFIGFFAYLITLTLQVRKSENFTIDWFLDGRRKKLKDNEDRGEFARQTTSAMNSQNQSDFD